MRQRGGGSHATDVIGRAKEGAPDALATLWRAHNPALLRYFRGRLADGAEDLAQQTWLDAARSLGRFEGDEVDFQRWLFTIGRRRLVDEQRRRGRRGDVLQAEPPDSASDEMSFALVDDLDRALALVRRLPGDQADAVLLRIVADLDVAHVAAIMGRSDSAVRVLVHRGLRRLERLTQVSETTPERAAINWRQ
jgi:RNA polymerase sigma-70 factor (ECF subfamily)